MPFHTTRLPNGLEIIGETTPTARSAAVGFYVRAGARDEMATESGVSHFLEHMVFKGTPLRSALDVNLDFDRVGADYNAYTSEENTVYYASCLPEYLPAVVDLWADVLRPSLREGDFDTEKQVILEEIKMYEDNPGSTAWDHARRLHFGPHPLGQTILGTTESVTALTAAQMKDYFDRRYSASNILVAAAGNFDWPAFVADVTAKCGTWPGRDVARHNLSATPGELGTHVVPHATSAQQHVLLLGEGPAAESPLRYAAAVLSVAVGDDTGSRLYWELVDPGRAESASCGTDPSQGCGLMATTFSCDPPATADNLARAKRVLADVQANGLTAEELAQAKNKIASRIVRGGEKPMGRLRGIAGSWLYLREYCDLDAEMARYDAVDAAALRAYLERYPLDRVTTVAYGPLTEL